MEILKFKMSKHSVDTQRQLAPILNKEKGVMHWNLNTNYHILTVSGENINPEKIEKLIESLGLQVDLMHVFGVSGVGL
ncbi:hypothetical protein [Xanthocytophaga flava]|nr:hypothetical protein [Xanthocytophaga flavus]